MTAKAAMREPPVGDHHHHRDRQQREQVAEAGDDARGEQLVQRLDVARHARHQSSDGRAIVEGDRQPLHVREQLLSEIAHHALPEQRGEHRLAIRAGEGEHERSPRR